MEAAFPENIPGISLLREEGAWKYIDVRAGLSQEALRDLLANMPADRELCFFEYTHGEQLGDSTGMYVMVQTFDGMCYFWKGNHGRSSNLARLRFSEMAELILRNTQQADAFIYIVPVTRRFEGRQDFKWHVAPPRAADEQAEILRHLLATIAFRFQWAVAGAAEGYWGFEAGSGVRRPVEILNHMRNVIEYCRSRLVRDERRSFDQEDYESEIAGFHALLAEMDQVLLHISPQEDRFKKALQGPLSDVLTHIGQLAMLRRMHGEPVRGISFVKAEVRTGNVSAKQLLPERA